MTDKDEKYQGWKNFETWGMSLTIENNQTYYNVCRTVAIDAFNGPVVYDESERMKNAAEALRLYLLDQFYNHFEKAKHTMISDILEQITDFSESTRIDFEAIAESLLEGEIDMKQYHKEVN